MAEFKNQHFVPKCLLRPFSLGGNGRSINMYNIDHDRLIPNASVKDQCASDYLYDNDGGLERALSGVEGQFSRVLKELMSGAQVDDVERHLLCFFAHLQFRRTEMAMLRLKNAYSTMETAIFGQKGLAPRKLSDRGLMIQSLKLCVDSREYINDLKVRIIENRTKVPFVISDDPAILVNKYAAQRQRGHGFGISSSGVILVMPLSPRLGIIAYDGLVYTFRSVSLDRVILLRDGDAEALNELQFIKAHENIYFLDWADGPRVQSGFKRAAHLRATEWTEFNYLIPFDETADGTRYRVGTREEGEAAREAIVQMAFKYPVPSRWLSGLTYRNPPKTFYEGTAVGHVRKPEWLRSRRNRRR